MKERANQMIIRITKTQENKLLQLILLALNMDPDKGYILTHDQQQIVREAALTLKELLAPDSR
ncbi:MAG: hypothetical protein ACRDGM_04265 [bacterium]